MYKRQVFCNASGRPVLIHFCKQGVYFCFALFRLFQFGCQMCIRDRCIGQEIDVLPVNGIKADEAHVKLAHAGVVILQLRDDDFVDELKVD